MLAFDNPLDASGLLERMIADQPVTEAMPGSARQTGPLSDEGF